MKKIFVILTVLFLSREVFAQQREQTIPQHVTTSFSTKYPDVRTARWQKDKETYQAVFSLDGKERRAYYTAGGEWKGTETTIRWTKHLPERIQAGWEGSGHINWKVNAIRHLEMPEKQMYVLHVHNGNLLDSDHHDAFQEEHILYFSGDGELIRKDRI